MTNPNDVTPAVVPEAPKDAGTYVQSLTAPAPGGSPLGFWNDTDSTQDAIMQLFDVPGDMSDIETVKSLLIRSDLPEHQVKLVSRVLALSQIFDPGWFADSSEGDPNAEKDLALIEALEEDEDEILSRRRRHMPSVARAIIAWYLLARIARNREGRKEYASVLGHKMRLEAEEDI